MRYINFITGTSTANALNTPSLGLDHLLSGWRHPGPARGSASALRAVDGYVAQHDLLSRVGTAGELQQPVSPGGRPFHYMLETATAGAFSLGVRITQFHPFPSCIWQVDSSLHSILTPTGANRNLGPCNPGPS